MAAWVQILGAIAVVELTVGKQDYENKVRAQGDWDQASTCLVLLVVALAASNTAEPIVPRHCTPLSFVVISAAAGACRL